MLKTIWRGPRVSMDLGFLGERESEDRVSPVLVIRERRHQMTWRERERGFPGSQREQRRCRSGQDTEGCTGASHRGQSTARRKDIVLAGEVCGVFDEQVRHRQRRKDTAAKTTRGEVEFGERILYMPPKPVRGGKWEPRFHPGVFAGMLNSSSQAVVVTE